MLMMRSCLSSSRRQCVLLRSTTPCNLFSTRRSSTSVAVAGGVGVVASSYCDCDTNTTHQLLLSKINIINVNSSSKLPNHANAKQIHHHHHYYPITTTNTRYFSSSSTTTTTTKMIRLSKRMSELDLCSRREADKLIMNSQVSIKGQPIDPILGQKVDAHEMDISIIYNHNNKKNKGSTNTNTNTNITTTINENKQNNDDDDHHTHTNIFDWNRIRGDTIVLNKPISYVSGQPDPKHGHTPAVQLLTRSNLYLKDDDGIYDCMECQETLSNGNYLHFGRKKYHRRNHHNRHPNTSWSNPTTTTTTTRRNDETTTTTTSSDTTTTKDLDYTTKSTLVNYAPAGRLDLDSSGLLLFTKNGVIAKKLLQPSQSQSSSSTTTNITKEYIVHVEPIESLTRTERTMGLTSYPYPPRWDLSILLKGGRRLWNDRKPLRPLVEAEWLEDDDSNDDEEKEGDEEEDGDDDGKGNQNNHTISIVKKKKRQSQRSSAWDGRGRLRLVLQEGKKRQIRRMCRELLGLHVTKLTRVRIGTIELKSLPVGMWRPLRKSEVQYILSSSSTTSSSSSSTA